MIPAQPLSAGPLLLHTSGESAWSGQGRLEWLKAQVGVPLEMVL